MAYLLQPLLNIRTTREERAAGELVAAKRSLAEAEDALAARKRDLEEFEKTKEERRDRIYDAIIGRPVSRDRIDMANEGVARIDEEGALKADNVARAEADRREREAGVQTARANFGQAVKNRAKIVEHRDVWRRDDALEQGLTGCTECGADEYLVPNSTLAQ